MIGLMALSGIFLVFGFAVFFDILQFKDDEVVPVIRYYIISQESDMRVTGNTSSMSTVDSGLYLVGTMEMKSTSRSAQNPISITMHLTPKPVFNIIKIEDVWKILPDKFHYVFTNALHYPETKDEYGIPQNEIIELSKYDNPPHYEGSGTVIYQDSGLYNFYLQESSQMLHPDAQGNVKFFHEFSNNTSNAKTMIAEAIYGNDGVQIGSYEQTLSADSKKQELFIALFGIASAIMIPIYLDYRKTKTISNKS